MTDSLDRPQTTRKTTVVLISIIAFVVVAWALKWAYVVVMPLAFAFFVAVLVRPIQDWLNDRLPDKLWWVSVTLTMATLVLVLAIFFGAFWLAFEMVDNQAPQYAETLQSKWQQFTGWLEQNNLPAPQLDGESGGLRERLIGWVQTIFTSIWGLAALLVLIFFLVLLILLEVRAWRDKSRKAFRDKRSEGVIDTVDAVAVKVRQYLLVRTFVSFISGVAAGLWLWAIGIDFAFLWGLLTFLLNYIPNIGSIISVIPPTLLALIQPEMGLAWALITLAGLTAIEQIIGNFIDPKLQGYRLDLSPLVVLLSVIFWGYLWGVAGALLAVPMTVTIVIICAHIHALRPVALLLSRTSDEEQVAKETHGRGSSF